MARIDNNERLVYRRTGPVNTGGWDSGGAITPPAWAVGTFSGRAPDGRTIVLTIENNGRVTANAGGSVSYGTFTRGNEIVINGARAAVTSTNRGIRTKNADTGEVISYRRQ